jgi:DNA-binding response OmpR family regulator
MHHILLVATRKTTIDSLHEILRQRHFSLSVARSLRAALQAARLHPPDLVIVDGTGPLEGASLSQELQRTLETPVIAIARDSDEATKMGAKFCLVRPYTARQLIETIQQGLAYPRELSAGPLRLDLRAHTIQGPHHTEPQALSPKLFSLLKRLMQAQGEAVPRTELMAAVWNTEFMDDTRTLDVHIRWLRQIIEPDSSQPTYLKTVRGVGYRIAPVEEKK